MSVLEREIRLVLERDSVDLTGATKALKIADVYFLRGDELSIRLRSERLAVEQHFDLTFKFWGRTGTPEEHLSVNPSQAEALFAAAARSGVQRVDKIRYLFPRSGALTWEIDAYAAPLDFFVIAECEYPTTEPPADLLAQPSWYRGGDWSSAYVDVTNDVRFFDSMLSGDPAELRRFLANRLAKQDDQAFGTRGPL